MEILNKENIRARLVAMLQLHDVRQIKATIWTLHPQSCVFY